MKIIEAINSVDDLKFNDFSQELKVGWLSRLDSVVKTQIIDTHEGGEDVTFTGYDSDTDLDATELLIPAPFDAVYLRWLEAQINYHNSEINRYNISISLFNTEYEAFENWYRRNHKPICRSSRFIF